MSIWSYRKHVIAIYPDNTCRVYLGGNEIKVKGFAMAKHYINQWLGNRLFIRKIINT